MLCIHSARARSYARGPRRLANAPDMRLALRIQHVKFSHGSCRGPSFADECHNNRAVQVMDESGQQTGWALLRASLHDPLIVINAESDAKGGARRLSLSLRC